jgi:hypothetical protein
MKFFSKQNFQEIIQGFENALRKYPLTLFTSFLAAIFTYLRVEIIEDRTQFAGLEALQVFFFLMIPLSFSFHVFRKKTLDISNKIMLALSFFAVTWTSFSYVTQSSDARCYFIILSGIAVHCLVACSFLTDQRKYFFWNANILMLHRFIFASLASLAVASGIVGLVFLFSYLIIEITSKGEIATFIYTFSCITLHTWIFVSGCNFENLEEDEDGKNLSRFKYLKYILQYVYIPLIFLYAIILITYLLKIAVLFDLPKGGVAYFVVSLSGFGILAYLLAFRFTIQRETSIFTLFNKYFFYLVCPLLILLWIATGRRLSDYGISPDRYLLLIVCIWLSLMTIYILTRKSEHLSAIPPLSLWAVCILMVITPLGPTGLPIHLMVKKVHQNLDAARKDPDSKVADHVRSSINEIAKLKNLEWMKREFKVQVDGEPSEYFFAGQILEALKIENQNNINSNKSLFCNRKKTLVLKNIHAKIFMPNIEIHEKEIVFDSKTKELTFTIQDKTIVYTQNEIKELFDACEKSEGMQPVLLHGNPNIIFYPDHLEGSLHNGKVEHIYRFSGTLIVK